MLRARPTAKLLLMAAVVMLLLVASGAFAQEKAPAAGADAPKAEPEPETGKEEAAEPEVDEPASLFDLILKGGWVMIPIAICSILALAIAIERGISLRRENVIPPDFLDGLMKALHDADDSVTVGVRYCDLRPCTVSNIFKAGIRRMRAGAAAMEKAIEDAGSREVYKLKRSVRPLSTIATVSPLLGLLGTVYGMITAFQTASALGVKKADALAVGIYEALVTTAAGLTLAIPVLIIYQIFCSRVDLLVDSIDEQAIELLQYTAYNGDSDPAHDAEGPAE